MFVRKDKQGRIKLLIAKVTDDLLRAGYIKEMDLFNRHIRIRFDVRKTASDDEITFNGCKLIQNTCGDVFMPLSDYIAKINPIPIRTARKKLLH